MIDIIANLSYCECSDCHNYFFVYDLPLGINDPNYCPYCGIDFTFIDEKEDIEDV